MLFGKERTQRDDWFKLSWVNQRWASEQWGNQFQYTYTFDANKLRRTLEYEIVEGKKLIPQQS